MNTFSLFIDGNMSDCIDFVSVLKNKNSLYYQPHIYDLEVVYYEDNVQIRGKSDVGAYDTFFGIKDNAYIKGNKHIYTLDKLSEIFNLYIALNFQENGFVDVWTYNCGKPLVVENKNLMRKENYYV